jgi:hypothetical protein
VKNGKNVSMNGKLGMEGWQERCALSISYCDSGSSGGMEIPPS